MDGKELRNFVQIVDRKPTGHAGTTNHHDNLLVTDEKGEGTQPGFSFKYTDDDKSIKRNTRPSDFHYNKSGFHALESMVYLATQTDQLNTPANPNGIAEYREKLRHSDNVEDKKAAETFSNEQIWRKMGIERYREGLLKSDNEADRTAAISLTDDDVRRKIGAVHEKAKNLMKRVAERTKTMNGNDVKAYMAEAEAIAQEAWHGQKPLVDVTEKPATKETPGEISIKWTGHFTSGRHVDLIIPVDDKNQLGEATMKWNAGTRDGKQLMQSSFLGEHLHKPVAALTIEKSAAMGADAVRPARTRPETAPSR